MNLSHFYQEYIQGVKLSVLVREYFFRATVLFACLIWGVGPLTAYLVSDTSLSLSELLFKPDTTTVVVRVLASLLFILFGLCGTLLILHGRRQRELLQIQREYTERIILSEPECVKTVAFDGTLLDMNPAGLHMVQADNIEQVRHQSVYDLIVPEDRQRYIDFNARVFAGASEQMQYDIIGINGGRKTVDSHAVPMEDSDGNVTAHLAITRDITEFKRSQEQILRFSSAIEQSASMVLMTDPDGVINYVNPRFTEVTGYSSEECIGATPKIIQSELTPRHVLDSMQQAIKDGREWRGKLQNRCKNGRLYWASIVISPIRNDQDDIINLLCTQEDITRTKELLQELHYHSNHCHLTGLINRSQFEKRLELLISRAQLDNSSHGILFIDLDQFKLINDTCGHDAGDMVLIHIANLLREWSCPEDSVARLSGDEYGVLLEGCNEEDALRKAEELRHRVDNLVIPWNEQRFTISLSIGVVMVDRSSTTVSETMKQVDTACYMAKDRGRNRVHLFLNDETAARHSGEMSWVARIRQGIEQDRFTLFGQRIVSLQDRQEQHLEILLRYQGDKGLIAPGEFLPAAERYGIAPRLDCWVVKTLFQMLSEQPELMSGIQTISVNLSGHSLTDESFRPFLEQTLLESGIKPSLICFEITETAVISHLGLAVELIEGLKKLGCRFALDDFGSGFSSYGYLKHLPVDYLKIDGMFVRDMLEDPIDHAMVRSINDIGHMMGKKTIAEFVENDALSDQLRQLGVDYAQGYGIERPMPLQELLQVMHQHESRLSPA